MPNAGWRRRDGFEYTIPRDHESEADALAVEQYRSYLLLLARRHLGGDAANRVEASDLVQQTLLDAHRQR